MPYLALYRRWRPQTFKDVVGQEHVVRTLRNAIALGRVAHAYLFCGPRGTGKTSIAKILAKSLNCEAGPTPDPCDKCKACSRIRDGYSMDVIEIDAASNRGIDEIRELRERVRYAPAEERYKVYIIDEVHMLTTEAFNALLKTLEEPPEYVIFILATTEPHRIPATILSRCQRFDFRRLTVKELAAQISRVLSSEGRTADDEAISLIARFAEGGMRDALSLLEQALSFSGEHVTFDQVAGVLGIAGPRALESFAESALSHDISGAMSLLHDILNEGKDLRQFFRDLMDYFKGLLIARQCKTPGQLAGLADVSEAHAMALMEQAGRFPAERLMDIIQQLSEIDRDLRSSSQPRITAEIGALKLIGLPESSAGAGVVTEPHISSDEGVPSKSLIASSPQGMASSSSQAMASTPSRVMASTPSEEIASTSEMAGEVSDSSYGSCNTIEEEDLLKRAVKLLKDRRIGSIWSILEKACKAYVRGTAIFIGFNQNYQMNSQLLSREKARKAVEAVFQELLGKPVEIRFENLESSAASENGDDANEGPRLQAAPDPSAREMAASSGQNAVSAGAGATEVAMDIVDEGNSQEDIGEQGPLIENSPEVANDPIVRQVAMFFGGRVLKAVGNREEN